MKSDYIILKFGNYRVLLANRKGESATMYRPLEGGYITFDYSGCDVIGVMNVKNEQPEPTPSDILTANAKTTRFPVNDMAR